MPAFKDIIGLRFGRLVVQEYKGGSRWLCLCDCGTLVDVSGANLGRSTFSCGCAHRDELVARNTTHGHAPRGKPTRAYSVWFHMIQRCTNPNDAKYHLYGGRGIKICARWSLAFENWLADNGEPPHGMTFDRIDVNGNYEPGNCRWASHRMQRMNQRRMANPMGSKRKEPPTT